MKVFLTSLRSLIFFILVLGGIYPLTITLLGSVLSPIRSHGSLLLKDQKVIGSELIGQKFTQEKYFWGRPSNADYVPLNSSATQRSGTDKKLYEAYKERSDKMPGAPADLLWASGSGLDPHISLKAAKYQIPRIAQVRNMSRDVLEKLILKAAEDRFLGFMGQSRINVLELNLLLDRQEM
ncbi:MAG: K(+)-transporting ATPase subunit C [Bacteriovoracaceae bacterium]